MTLFKGVFLGFVVSLIFISCDPMEQVGSDYCPSDNFVLKAEDVEFNIVGDNAGSLSSADNKLSLDGSGLNIYSKFPEVVNWKITIEMIDGSAERTFKGESDSINIFWYGSSKSLPLFSKGEVKVVLTIACRSESIERNFTITENPTFKNLNPQYGVLIRDWDQNGSFPVTKMGKPTFQWGGGDGFKWAVSAEVEYKDESPSPQGGYYLSIKDKRDEIVWYYGATGINASSFVQYDNVFESLPTSNPEDLWFNVYVRGDQNYKNTSVELVWGLDYGSPDLSKYLKKEHLNWEGWKMLSFPLSEFLDGTNPMPNFVGFDNSESFLAFQLGSQPQKDNEAQLDFDFAIITVGGPFLEENNPVPGL